MWPEALRAGSDVAGGDRDTERIPAERRRSGTVVFLETRVGTGALTEVWLARSASGRPLAVKRFIDPDYESQAHWLLEREALLLSRCAHPALVATHGVLAPGRIAEADGTPSHRPGLALEYLGGGDLVALAGSDPRHWARALGQVLGAVAHLHAAGYVHGDIKARNVLLDMHGRAKLIDLSTCLPIGAVCSAPLGTPSQQRSRGDGHRVTEDDDVFASAALVFEMIAGCPAFADRQARAALQPSAVPPGRRPASGPVAGLLDVVYGMLRARCPLGAAELDALARTLATQEHGAAA